MIRARVVGLCMDIEGFMRQNRFPRGYDIFQHHDGTPLTEQEARSSPSSGPRGAR